jgi:hypothetical protein
MATEQPATTTPSTSSVPAPADDVAAKIKKQLEFYFGDSNFPSDKHLQIQSKLNPEGCILTDLLLSMFISHLNTMIYFCPFST